METSGRGGGSTRRLMTGCLSFVFSPVSAIVLYLFCLILPPTLPLLRLLFTLSIVLVSTLFRFLCFYTHFRLLHLGLILHISPSSTYFSPYYIPPRFPGHPLVSCTQRLGSSGNTCCLYSGVSS
jgi:hypothetical protein